MSEKRYVPSEEKVDPAKEAERLQAWGLDDHTFTPQEYQAADQAAITKNTYEDVFGDLDRTISAGNNMSYEEVRSLLDDAGVEDDSKVHTVEASHDRIYSNLGLVELAELARDAESHDDKSTSLEAQTAIQDRLAELVEKGELTEEGAMNRIDQLDAIMHGAPSEKDTTTTTTETDSRPLPTPEMVFETAQQAKDNDPVRTFAIPGSKKRPGAAKAASEQAVTATPESDNTNEVPVDVDVEALAREAAANAKRQSQEEQSESHPAKADVDPVATANAAAIDAVISGEKDHTPTNEQPADTDEKDDEPAKERTKKRRLRKLGQGALDVMTGAGNKIAGAYRKRQNKKRAKRVKLMRASQEIAAERNADDPKDPYEPLTSKDFGMRGIFRNSSRDYVRQEAREKAGIGGVAGIKNRLRALDQKAEKFYTRNFQDDPQINEDQPAPDETPTDPIVAQTEPMTNVNGGEVVSPADANKTQEVNTRDQDQQAA